MEDQFVLWSENFTNKKQKNKTKTELEENDQAEVQGHGGLQAAIQPTECLMSQPPKQ